MLDIDPADDSLKCFSSSKKQYFCNKKIEGNIVQKIFLILLEPVYIFYLYLISRKKFTSKFFGSNPKKLNIGFILMVLSLFLMMFILQDLNNNPESMVFTFIITMNVLYLGYIEIRYGKGYPLEVSSGREIEERKHKHVENTGYGFEEENKTKDLNKKSENDIIQWEE